MKPRRGCARACPISSSSTGCCRAFRASSSVAGCARGRRRKRLPVIMLTAAWRRDRAGARPCHRRRRLCGEALLRARASGACAALLRRAKPEHVATLLRAGDIELDRETHRVHRSGREVHLGPTEFRLLEFLMQRSGASSPASSCSTACGARTSISTSAPWTCMWAAAQGDQSRPPARSHPHRARRRLFLQRNVRPRPLRGAVRHAICRPMAACGWREGG